MSAFGTGSGLWRVDIVLRRGDVSNVLEQQIRERLISQLDAQPTVPDQEHSASITETSSYDQTPPDGSIGYSTWVRADTAGRAVQTAHDAVLAAVREVTGHALPLWDVRAMPRSAMSP